jgi:hypothetical protein
MWAQHLTVLGITDTSEPFTTSLSLAGAPVDPTFSNVVLVAENFAGINGNTIAQATPVHSSNWTSSASNSTYSNGFSAPAIFGATRGLIGANSAWAGVVAGTPSFDINTQDFCVEMIIEFADISADRALAAVSQSNNSRQWEFWWDQSENELVLQLWELLTGDTPDAELRWPLVAATGTNYEIAVGRDTNGVRCYVNGSKVGLEYANSTDVYHSAGVHNFIGYNNNSQLLKHGNQYYDCYRFTIGEMHITQNYVARTASEPYPTS